MYEVIYWGSVPLHWLLMALCCLLSLGAALLLKKKSGLTALQVCLYGALAAALGFFFGRLLYCMVYGYEIFQDEMGDFAGLWPFFDPAVGSVNVMGFVLGLLLAAPVSAALTKQRAAAYLDAAVIPALLMYILARMIEPLSGQGYGDFMGYEVCVSWLEAALTAVLLALVPCLHRKSGKPGTLAQHALVLWCLAQLLPESLRCDDALFVFVFARVTHLGLAVTIGVTLLRLLIAGRKHLSAKAIALDVAGLAAGLGLCIATIFALDKTNLPKLLVYAVMLLSIAGLACVVCRRIQKEDAV